MISKDKASEPIEKILSAARKCYLENSISSTGMKEVSQAAKVSRSTLYRYFPSKDDVLVAVVKREMEAVNILISKKLQRYDQPADVIVEGLIMALTALPKRPLLKAVFASDEDSKARRIIWNSDIIIEFGEQLLEHVIQPALELGILQNQIKPEIMVEWVYRVLLSLLTLPSNWIKSDEELRATLHALLIPVLLR
jgi:AcrR family transcriptional regulator